MSLVEELRSKKSRDNRELLDRAADRIEELEKLLASTPTKETSFCRRGEKIEEMARVMCLFGKECGQKSCKGCEIAHNVEYWYAKRLYNAGYRKQSEGEWQIKSEIHQMFDDVDEELYVECPFCQRKFYVPYEFDDEKIFKYAREHYPYCNCGAKMKGGELHE